MYLKPFKWHSRFPFVFFWPTAGRGNKSRKIGLFPLFKFNFYCSTISYFAFFSLVYVLIFFCKAFTCFSSSVNLAICWLLNTISLTNTLGYANLGKDKFDIELGKWKLNLNDANLPSSLFTTLFNNNIWNGMWAPLIGKRIVLFLLSM